MCFRQVVFNPLDIASPWAKSEIGPAHFSRRYDLFDRHSRTNRQSHPQTLPVYGNSNEKGCHTNLAIHPRQPKLRLAISSNFDDFDACPLRQIVSSLGFTVFCLTRVKGILIVKFWDHCCLNQHGPGQSEVSRVGATKASRMVEAGPPASASCKMFVPDRQVKDTCPLRASDRLDGGRCRRLLRRSRSGGS